MKYIVDLPKEYISGSSLFGEILSIPIQINGDKNYNIPTSIKITPYTEPDRTQIEDEVWEFVRIITDMTERQRKECFGKSTCDLDEYLTYQEAKAKYEAWKAEKAEIRVGDEVVIDYDKTAVVLWLNEYGNVGGYVYSDGKAYINGTGITSFKKTGRHFDEVEELLRKMREE